ncbi:glutamate-tRNA ligase [Rhinocladiella mackenziei CBS 650.93]|uniref:Glutamate--tRNA ligase, mitochondrial n=1 Tax=Rhinocladiella mackenziei CBS 650.93 TaxID=1442369 RepID=A0A0D2J387_9EURO|nr:glutamate-tRNA ligase [Rhinocladiella mackenziei CBS 650.93]KIX10141.1 glutamate-tRNA ligase [Rhinocladiella mackenziei CBS 650.93]
MPEPSGAFDLFSDYHILHPNHQNHYLSMSTVQPARLVKVVGWVCSSCRARQAAKYPEHAPSSLIKTRKSSSTSTPPKRGRLPDTPARTRFAPSPTGNLHLGSIRTALFNYLLARATKGQFLLRIEDTDAKRTILGAEDRLYQDLRWAGLQWDEGPIVGGPYGPYRQSERLTWYQTHVENLLKTGRAYRCFCSPERIDELNRHRHQKGLSLGYDRKCIHIPSAEAEGKAHNGEQHVIRFRSPDVWPRYNDLVYGKSGHGAEKTKKLLLDEPVYEDVILMKSDGFPTYHWANVCDDHDMHITHVVRGSEWMSSTPLHVALYQSLNWTPPVYAHVPLLVDEKKQKLSKRNLDSDVANFRTQGILPEAVVNFAALLGWSHTQKKDVFDLSQLESLFDLKITKGNTIVSPTKLVYLQRHHARRRVRAQGERFEQLIRDVAVAVLDEYGAARIMTFLSNRPLRGVIAKILQLQSLHFISAAHFAEHCCSIFIDPPSTKPEDLESIDLELLHPLRVAASTLCLVPPSSWTEEVHRAQLRQLETPPSNDIEPKRWKTELYHYLRWVLLGGNNGPGIAETMEVLGRDACVEKIQAANQMVKEFEMAKSKPKVDPEMVKSDGDDGGSDPAEKEKMTEWKSYTL